MIKSGCVSNDTSALFASKGLKESHPRTETAFLIMESNYHQAGFVSCFCAFGYACCYRQKGRLNCF